MLQIQRGIHLPYIGAKIKEETVKKIEGSLKSSLPSGEFIVAYFKMSHYKPLTDAVVITNHRLFAVYVDGLNRNKGYPTEILADDIEDVRMTLGDTLVLTLKDGTKKKLGRIIPKEEKDIFTKAIDKASGSPAYLNIDGKSRQTEKTLKQKDKEELRSSEEQRKNQEREQAEQEKQQRQSISEAENDKWQSLITGKVNKAALREVKNSCRDGEVPEFILGDGINGVLVAFDDRCMIIKKGLGTSFMASSLGGGRVATFAYHDITGIEYNSGIMTGVLEILTSSYTGKTTNSPWTFGNEKSAHESSNTLPWGKVFYSQVRTKIEWLKHKILEAKTPNSPTAQPSQSLSATEELSKLADLHKQGLLTGKEFEDAKQKIIGKM